MTKREVARTLKAISFFLRLKDDNPYKARAYEQAGEALLLCPRELCQLVNSATLTEVKGIGPATAAVITELVSTGVSAFHRSVQGSYPSSLVELGEVPGLSMKQIRRLYEDAGITSVAKLHAACRTDGLRTVRGIGPKVQAKIVEALGAFGRGQGYRLLANVLEEAATLEEGIRAISGVRTVTVAGALRRKMEVINDYHFVVCWNDSETSRFLRDWRSIPNVSDTGKKSPNLVTATSATGMPVTITLAPCDDYDFYLLQATGSAGHLEQLLAKFASRGLKDWDAVRTGLKGCNEQRIYGAIGLPYIPPELREGGNELELVQDSAIVRLIEPSQIQGSFHVHTDYSDGTGTVEEMVVAAREQGYHYLGISDHSQSAFYANGLKEPRIRQQWREIEEVQRRHPDIHIFRGIEADILPDGSMDYRDPLLAEFDFVIASVHSRFNLPEADQTRRVCRALSNPYVTMLGHPTGRLLLSRPGYRIDLSQVIHAAATHRKILEINGSRHRLDLDWRVVRLAKAQSVEFSINPDAHAVEELRNLSLGVHVARKGGLQAEDVINTLSLSDMKTRLLVRERRQFS